MKKMHYKNSEHLLHNKTKHKQFRMQVKDTTTTKNNAMNHMLCILNSHTKRAFCL